ncbi:MAG: tandem-95 repeat protein, partial [Planctomycetales bacterium]|nr:tandem-95 repeat protein [Planctomycetales bacterium]
MTRKKTRSRSRQRDSYRLNVEQLESRQLLAGDLVAHWQAENLNATTADGESVSVWEDSVRGIVAAGEGEPTLVRGGIGGRSIVRFETADGDDSLVVAKDDSPLAGASDFSIVVAFVTDSSELLGDVGDWFQGTGLVDGNSFGLTNDWGVAINSSGQIVAGIGAGFGNAPTTVRSTRDRLNDGQLHVATFTRSGGDLAIYVDGDQPNVLTGADESARSERLAIRFGMLQNGGNPFNGDVAEIHIYDGALSSEEVADTYDQIQSFYNNEAPAAVDDVYETVEDSLLFAVPVAQGVLANDADAEQDPLTATIVDDVQHGTLSLRPDGSFIYVPQKDFFGEDRFTYTAADIQPSNVATATINVLPAYDSAIAIGDQYKLQPTETLSVNAAEGVLANDINVDLVELTAVLESDVTEGSLSLSADGSFVFDPQGFARTTSFSYRVNDGTNLSSSAEVSLVVNTPPAASSDTYGLNEDSPLLVAAVDGVLANDVDADGDVIEATLLQPPANGSVEFNSNGSFVYSPNAEFSGDDLFSYEISDGVDQSAATLVFLNVAPVNDAPVAAVDTFFALSDQLIEVSAMNGLLANDTDVDSAILSAVLVGGPLHGTLSLNADGSFSYRANAGYTGADSFTYRATDSIDTSAVTEVTIVINTIESLQQVVINEVHYDPNESAEALEFIELHNRGSFPVDISGWSFSDGIDFTFPDGATIGANGFVVISQDPISARTKFEVDSVGPWLGRLDNDGETIQLRTSAGALIDEVTYKLGFPWPTVGDDPGHSIQLINADLDNDLGGSWRSAAPTPNAANSVIVGNSPPHM